MNRVIWPADSFEELQIQSFLDDSQMLYAADIERLTKKSMIQAIATAIAEKIILTKSRRNDLAGSPMMLRTKIILVKPDAEPCGFIVDKPPEDGLGSDIPSRKG